MDKYEDDELTLDEDDAKRIEKAKTKALKRKKFPTHVPADRPRTAHRKFGSSRLDTSRGIATLHNPIGLNQLPVVDHQGCGDHISMKKPANSHRYPRETKG